MVTRAQTQAQFDHVLNEVLDRDDDSHLKRALAQDGFDNILALVNIDDTVIPLLEYTDEANVTIGISRGDQGLLRTFCKYVAHLKATGVSVEDEWLNMTAEDFDEYRVRSIGTQLGNTVITAQLPNAVAAQPRSAVETFRRGIKLDPSVFPILKDEKHHDGWHRSVCTHARAQGVEDVLDPTYMPNTPEEIALFREKQKYMYAVLETILRTDRGKAFIREHENDFDAQRVYGKTLAYHRTSTKAQIQSSDNLTYITSAKLGGNDWQGTTEGFILHWQNQVRMHERMVNANDRLTDTVLKTLLENAVHPIADLRQVKDNAALHQTHTGIPLTYAQYCTLLLSAAAGHDAQVQAKRGKRQVLMHDYSFMDSYEAAHELDEGEYDIDMPVDVIQANAMNRARPRGNGSPTNRAGMLPPDTYKALSQPDQQAWRQISESGRVSIVAQMSTTSGGNQPSQTSGGLQANIHDMASPEANENDANDGEPDGADPIGDGLSTLLVNAASNGPRLPPGDIRRVMSKASTRTVAMADITYTVSAHQLLQPVSLVDRGANGGVGGDDVRVIKRGAKTVDIRGVGNHQVNDVALGTVGGVIATQLGPAIAIFHQYALLGTGPSVHSSAQLEHYKNEVNDKSAIVGGLQRVQTVHGYIIPLNIRDGLPRLMLRPFTDTEWKKLPHVIMTSETDWDPSVMDHAMDEDDMSTGSRHDNDIGSTIDAGTSLPSPPTQAFGSTEMICGERVGSVQDATDERANQVSSPTLGPNMGGADPMNSISTSTMLSVPVSGNHGESDPITRAMTSMMIDGKPIQVPVGINPMDVRRIVSNYGYSIAEQLLAVCDIPKQPVIAPMAESGTRFGPDSFVTPMKNGRGEPIQLTSLLNRAPSTTVQRPVPMSAPNATSVDSQSKSQALFDHILDEVFGRDNKSILKRALVQEGFGTLARLTSMSDRDIHELSFFDDECPRPKLITITEGDVNLVHAFHAFMSQRRLHGLVLDRDWFTVTGKQFAIFRFQHFPQLQWDATVAYSTDGSGMSPVPVDAIDNAMESLEALTFPTSPANGAIDLGDLLQDSPESTIGESSRSIASVRMEEVIDQAIQFGRTRGFANTDSRLPYLMMGREETISTALSLGIDDLLDKAIDFGEAYGILARLLDMHHEPQEPIPEASVYDDAARMFTPRAVVPLPTPATTTKDDSFRVYHIPWMRDTPLYPVSLDYGEHTSAFTVTNLSTSSYDPDNTLKRSRQDEEKDTVPKVKMRGAGHQQGGDQQEEGPTSNEWGVSTF
jgi:hypothetical protein